MSDDEVVALMEALPKWWVATAVAQALMRPPSWLLRLSTITSAPVIWWWDWRFGAMTVRLGEMERKGLLESAWSDEVDIDGSRRRVYRAVKH